MKKTNTKVQTSEPKTAKSVSEQIKAVAVKNQEIVKTEDKRLYNRFCSQITKEYKKMENCYLNTAFALHALYSKKIYKVGNYQNIYELAADKFSIARGTCNNFINICNKFGLPNENDTIIDLQDTFKPYSMSQLMVMLNMNQELLNMCAPEMSVRALKDMKNKYVESHTDESKQIGCDSAGETMNSPESGTTDEEYSSTVTDGKLFVCSALTYDELVKLHDIIVDAMEEVKKDKNVKEPRFELNIVF